ncbi:probable plastid-lipid-associated protein 4, chloroplastic isoform X3 [Juglans microcarpa x Juglans regia]|uniref:probable plastid-lipid-associated protein 4, chloroplastic isoform X3 n=1 Tax=Juglans microcarpa x Juglans regia TaxID=2249226 RepID=UPI001B7E0EED|nr:probable plastid-lipid-associated protein 4, chloroplastic isoform X3 [Juglans microcarpa x Juglans regia]
MALSSHAALVLTTAQSSKPSIPKSHCFPPPRTAFRFPVPAINPSTYNLSSTSHPEKWRAKISFFPAFLKKGKDAKTLKEELLEAIAPLDRGADATFEDQQTVDQRPKFLRSSANYQAINLDVLRAQNMESWPFFNQVTADLTPLNAKKVAVKFDYFKIGGLIPVKAPDRARGELEITYLDEELRVSRGDKGNLFILKMVDPSYRVPV